MFHLARIINAQGYTLKAFSCNKDPFIKGATLDKEDFTKLAETEPGKCCKKCLKKVQSKTK